MTETAFNANKIFGLLLCVVVLMTSCDSRTDIETVTHKANQGEYVTPEQTKQNIIEEIQAILGKNCHKASIPLKTPFDTLICSFYQQRNYEPAWINQRKRFNPEGAKLLNFLSGIRNYGLDSSFYEPQNIRNLVNSAEIAGEAEQADLLYKAEILMTQAYFLAGTHLRVGFLNPTTYQYKWKGNQLDINLVMYLDSALKRRNIEKSLVNLQPRHLEYDRLQKALARFLNRHQISKDSVIVIPSAKTDSVAHAKKIKEILISLDFLDRLQAENDSTYKDAVRLFQEWHGLEVDGIVGPQTLQVLSTTNYELFRIIALNLERWRWEETWSPTYVFVNIPAFQLKIIEDNAEKETMKVVLGALAWKTPEITSAINYIVTYPYWNVPRNIAVKELLPKIKKDPAFLKSNYYEVLDQANEVIDPSTINWTKITKDNFNYNLRKEGGPWNDMGLIKFMFPNKHKIYLHDTPARQLFSEDMRFFSHGCIRLEEPFELAKFLLKHGSEKYNIQDIQAMIDSTTNKWIPLEPPQPVYIRYFTSSASDKGLVQFHKDIYGKDEKFLQRKEPIYL